MGQVWAAGMVRVLWGTSRGDAAHRTIRVHIQAWVQHGHEAKDGSRVPSFPPLRTRNNGKSVSSFAKPIPS